MITPVTPRDAFDFARRLAAMSRAEIRAVQLTVAEEASDRAQSPREGQAFTLLAAMLDQVGR